MGRIMGFSCRVDINSVETEGTPMDSRFRKKQDCGKKISGERNWNISGRFGYEVKQRRNFGRPKILLIVF